MKISPEWLRDFVDLKVDKRTACRRPDLHGLAVEGISDSGLTEAPAQAIFEIEFTTNRPDAMNHYGVARECSAIYDIELKPLQPQLPASHGPGRRSHSPSRSRTRKAAPVTPGASSAT